MCVSTRRAQPPKNKGEKMKTLRFGIEIETIGQTLNTVAQAIKSITGGYVRRIGSSSVYDPYEVIANDGRTWKVMADSSLSASRDLQAEIVSPILRYDDIETLQEIIRAARRVGAQVDASCGIHIHIDAARFSPKAIRNMVKIFNKQEELIMHALSVSQERQRRWCKGIDQAFLDKIERQRPNTLSAINEAWYGYHNANPIHYDSTRYAALNLHNVWFRGTIEIRAFNATLHAGKIKAYIQLTLALAAKAINARAASSKRRPLNRATAKYDFRVFLLSLGLIGEEFKTARLHLLANLQGSAAWKHGRPTAQSA